MPDLKCHQIKAWTYWQGSPIQPGSLRAWARKKKHFAEKGTGHITITILSWSSIFQRTASMSECKQSVEKSACYMMWIKHWQNAKSLITEIWTLNRETLDCLCCYVRKISSTFRISGKENLGSSFGRCWEADQANRVVIWFQLLLPLKALQVAILCVLWWENRQWQVSCGSCSQKSTAPRMRLRLFVRLKSGCQRLIRDNEGVLPKALFFGDLWRKLSNTDGFPTKPLVFSLSHNWFSYREAQGWE